MFLTTQGYMSWEIRSSPVHFSGDDLGWLKVMFLIYIHGWKKHSWGIGDIRDIKRIVLFAINRKYVLPNHPVPYPNA